MSLQFSRTRMSLAYIGIPSLNGLLRLLCRYLVGITLVQRRSHIVSRDAVISLPSNCGWPNQSLDDCSGRGTFIIVS